LISILFLKGGSMRRRKLVLLVMGLAVLLCINSFAETKKLRQVGQYPLVRVKGDIPTSEVMKMLVETYPADIKYGFDLAGYGDLYFPFMDQLRAAEFEEVQLPIGQKFMWMLFRSQGKIKVVEDLEWAGNDALPAFLFTVNKDYKNYKFIMPKPCGNIALIGIEEAVPPATCDITVTPVKANINDTITVDMSGTKDAKSMEFDIIDPEGNIMDTKQLTPEEPSFQIKLDTPGEYMFKAKAYNMEGVVSTNPCEASTYINFPPICKLWTSCMPCIDYVGRPITFDASNSTDPDGEVVKADFEIKDAEGNIVDTYTDSEKPFAWEKIFKTAGIYTVTAVVTDDFGAVSQPAMVELEVTQKRAYFLAEGMWLFARGSAGKFVGARLGLLYNIVPDTLDFIISGGGALTLDGSPWKSFFMANALLNIHAGPAFFGAGAGFDTKVREERNADAVLIGNFGFKLFENYSNSGSLFFETHAPLGEGRSFSKHYKVMLGFRMLF
jgi:hypothetical protein